MDQTDALTDDSNDAAVDVLTSLPTLPPAPVLPPRSPAVGTADGTADGPVDDTVSLAPAWTTPAPNRKNYAANAPYGAMPSKPRAGEPSPAALQAAEQRRRTRKRRRVRRLAMVVIAIAVVALAGPPTARWIADGFDKAGSLETESLPAGDDTD